MMDRRIVKNLIFFLIAGLFLGFALTVRAESANVVKIGSDITIEEGTKVRNVLTVGGQITIDGFVENHVVAVGGSVVLTQSAVIGGNVISLGGVIVQGRGAEVHGNLTEINSEDISAAITKALSDEWEGWSWIFAIVSVSIFIGVLMLTLLIVYFIPQPIRVISTAIREMPLKVTLWGIVGLILVVPLAVLLAVSVIGIVLIPLEMTVVLFAVLFGFVAVSQLVGEKLFTVLKRHDHSIVRETIWGLIILWLIGWIPYVGWMLKVFAIVLGLGSVLVTRFGSSYSR
ncbi:MAG: hypothetical protein NTZ24_08275 [Deltaproteobacteria bacterium]|nr:hypothetical protein [Deltaproteobacteria bacterium]